MLERIRQFLPRRSDYNFRYLTEDLLAGFTVAIVALPLALAFGITSGAGAAAGLYTAIVAGVLAAIFGGSNYQVSGPTGAMTVVLLPVVAQYGVQALLIVGALAGLLLILYAFSGIGKYVNYIPWPVIAGFTTGIGAIIFLQQLPAALGVDTAVSANILQSSWDTILDYASSPSLAPVLLTVITIVFMLGWQRLEALRAVPASMAALLAGTFISLLPVFSGIQRIGAIPSGLPMPALPIIPEGDFTGIIRAALAVSVLAALESLLSATVADGMTTGERHDPNRELFGQGIANIGAALFGGVPATAALARTAVNVRSGARTRLSAIVHGLTLLVISLFLAPLAAQIPMAVLAGILMIVAVRMVEPDAIRIITRASKSDAFVLILTFVITVLFDLILAIEVGLIAAAALFIIRVSRMFSIDPMGFGRSGEVAVQAPGSNGQAPAKNPVVDEETQEILERQLLIYRIDGPMFFGAANRFIDQLLKIDGDLSYVILRMKEVPVMDVTGGSALEAILAHLERRDIGLLLAGVQEQPYGLLERTGLLERLEREPNGLFPTTKAAVEHARERLAGKPRSEPTVSN